MASRAFPLNKICIFWLDYSEVPVILRQVMMLIFVPVQRVIVPGRRDVGDPRTTHSRQGHPRRRGSGILEECPSG